MSVIDMGKYRKVKGADVVRDHASDGSGNVCDLTKEDQKRRRARAKEGLLRAAAKLDW